MLSFSAHGSKGWAFLTQDLRQRPGGRRGTPPTETAAFHPNVLLNVHPKVAFRGHPGSEGPLGQNASQNLLGVLLPCRFPGPAQAY